MSDLELAERACNGDRGAFQQLLERHYAMIHRVAMRFTLSAADAEDIAQDVCLALVGKLRSFRGNSAFSTWLYTVVMNACRDFARKQKTARTMQENYSVFRALDDGDQADDTRRACWLHETLGALEENLRETALLVVAEELSHADAGKILNCAESTVSWRMHEVRKKLKAQVDTFHDR